MGNGTLVIEVPTGFGTESWPIEVRALVASLQVQNSFRDNERRREARYRYEVQAKVWFKDDASSVRNATVYTRDKSKRMVAFVCSNSFKVGQSVNLDLPDASGAMKRMQGHIRRCRQVRGWWFDCLFEFLKGDKAGR